MSSYSETKESKILDILQHLESINLTLKDVVEYKNEKIAKTKIFDSNYIMNRNWASEDEDDDEQLFVLNTPDKRNEKFIDDYENVSSNIQNFIVDVLNTNEDLVSLLMSSWGNIKINQDTANDNEIYTNTETKETDTNILKKSCWGGVKKNSDMISERVKTTPMPKYQSKYKAKVKQYKLTDEIIQGRINVYDLDDFRDCISPDKKMKGCVRGWNCTNKFCKKFYHIHPDAHCNHTYNGTLCENVLECKKIHIQRCLIEIDHYSNGAFVEARECTNKNKSCSFVHRSDLESDEAKDNFDNTMDDYKRKKYKQFFNNN